MLSFEWLSFVPSTSPEEQIRGKRNLPNLLPSSTALLEHDDFVAEELESLTHIVLGRVLRVTITDIRDPHASFRLSRAWISRGRL